MTVGQRIKRLRKEKGWTQSELAEQLGVTKAAVQKYENGTITNFKIDVLKRLCEIFDCPTMLFVYDKLPVFSWSETTEKLFWVQYGEDFTSFLSHFQALNERGQQKVIDYVKDLSQLGVYTNEKGC